MKKITFLTGLVVVFLSPVTFAYISGKGLKMETPIYCPPVIDCNAASDSIPMDKCTFKEDSQYWEPFSHYSAIPSGIYKLINVEATYHSNPRKVVSCTYKNTTHNFGQFNLLAKLEANLEAYYSNSSKWVIYNGKATCNLSSYPGVSASCPLKKISAIIIHNIATADSVYASIDNIGIGGAQIAPNYFEVPFDNALIHCSSVKICKIDIKSSNNTYGTIFVDMDNEMKIINITSYPLWLISKVEPFNVIEIRYALEPSI